MGQKKRNSEKKIERMVGLLIKMLDTKEHSIPQVVASLLNEIFRNEIKLHIFFDQKQPPEYLFPDNFLGYFKELGKDKIKFAKPDPNKLKPYSKKQKYVPFSGLKNRYMIIANELVEKKILIKNSYSDHDIRYHLNPNKIYEIFNLIFTFLFPKIDDLLIEGQKSINNFDIDQKLGLFAHLMPDPTILSFFIKSEMFQNFSQNILNIVQTSSLTQQEKIIIYNHQFSYILSVMSQKPFIFLTFLKVFSQTPSKDFTDPQKWEMFAVNCLAFDFDLHNDSLLMSKFCSLFEENISKIRKSNDSHLPSKIINERLSNTTISYKKSINDFLYQIKTYEDNFISDLNETKLFQQGVIECYKEFSKI
jgi:hypothetical protein